MNSRWNLLTLFKIASRIFWEGKFIKFENEATTPTFTVANTIQIVLELQPTDKSVTRYTLLI